MSTTLKYIIPLLDNKLNLQDIDKNTGFIDAYTIDINKPYLDNHIFLLYYDGLKTKESYDRHTKLKSLSSLHSYREIKIDGKLFTLYVFPIIKKEINDIKSNCISLSDKDRMRVITFWNFTDTDINDYMIDPLTSLYIDFIDTVVPEEDYIPEFELKYNEKSGALLYESTPL